MSSRDNASENRGAQPATPSLALSPPPQPPTAMPLFQQLAAEMRQKIYRNALPEHLVVSILSDSTRSSPRLISINFEEFKSLPNMMCASPQSHKDVTQAIKEHIRDTLTITLDCLIPHQTFTNILSTTGTAAKSRILPPENFTAGAHRIQIRLPVGFEPRKDTASHHGKSDTLVGEQDLIGVLTINLRRSSTQGAAGVFYHPWELVDHTFHPLHLPTEYSIFIDLKYGIEGVIDYVKDYIEGSSFTITAQTLQSLTRQLYSFGEFPNWLGQAPYEDFGPVWRKMNCVRAKDCYDDLMAGESFCHQDEDDDDDGGREERAMELGVQEELKRRHSISDFRGMH